MLPRRMFAFLRSLQARSDAFIKVGMERQKNLTLKYHKDGCSTGRDLFIVPFLSAMGAARLFTACPDRYFTYIFLIAIAIYKPSSLMGEGDIVSGLNAFLWDAIQARYPVFFIRRDLHAMQPLIFRIRSAGMAVKQCHVWQNE